MKYSLLILFSSICMFLSGQGIKNEALIGSWEVIQIDNKIFKGGVITYFEFTADQELIARSINRNDQIEQKSDYTLSQSKVAMH